MPICWMKGWKKRTAGLHPLQAAAGLAEQAGVRGGGGRRGRRLRGPRRAGGEASLDVLQHVLHRVRPVPAVQHAKSWHLACCVQIIKDRACL